MRSTSRPQTDRTTESMTGWGVVAITQAPPPAVPVQTVPPRAAGLQAAPAGEGGAQEPGVRRGRRGLLGRAGRREKAV